MNKQPPKSSGGVVATGEVTRHSAVPIAQIEQPQSPSRQGLDPLTLEQVMKKYGVPGVSVAVIKDFRIECAKGYGTADVETNLAVDAHTLFQAASISKAVTAVAVLKAAQDGRMSLDVDFNTYLRSWKIPQGTLSRSPVTARALLSHTSGADDGFGFPGYAPSEPRPTLVQILNGEKPSNVGPVCFERPPFVAYKYSGGGTTILQLAMLEVFGEPFAELMSEQVFQPLHMQDSTFEQPLPSSFDTRSARAHDGYGKAKDVKWHVYPEQAAAGLWTTPSDLALVVIEIQRALQGPAGRLLSQAAAQEMITPVGMGPYSVGAVIKQRGEGWYFSHDGGNWGFQCRFVGHVRKGYGMVVMTNGDWGIPVIDEIQNRIASAYDWDLLDKPLPR